MYFEFTNVVVASKTQSSFVKDVFYFYPTSSRII